jgi:hypothetical protein
MRLTLSTVDPLAKLTFSTPLPVERYHSFASRFKLIVILNQNVLLRVHIDDAAGGKDVQGYMFVD